MKRILPILAIIAMIASLPVFAESKVESIQTNTVSTVEDDVFSSGESPDIKTGIRRVHHSPRTVIFYGSGIIRITDATVQPLTAESFSDFNKNLSSLFH